MTMLTDAEKQAAALEDQKSGMHEELEVVPTDQGVNHEAYNVHLSWRSWV